MSEEKLLTVRDVAMILGVSEKEVMDLAESGAIPAYKVGGVFVRFKKEQVFEYRRRSNSALPEAKAGRDYSVSDRVSDFFYFNDFYILSALIVALLVIVILRY